MSEKILSNGLTHAQSVQKLLSYTQGGMDWNFENSKRYLDIAYDTVSDRQKIDIYVPEGEGPFPCVVEVHGGGWFTGDRKDSGLSDVAWYIPHGIAIVSIGYRLTDEAVWPAQMEDVEKGLAKLLEVGPSLGIDTTRMCATGGSAGTTLSLLMALRSKKFKCAIMLASILDFPNMRKQFEVLGIQRSASFGYPDQDWSIEGLLMGGSCEEVPDVVKEITPASYVDEDCPHILLYHGMLDKATPYIQSTEFAGYVCRKTGDRERAKCVLLPATGHSNGDYKVQWTVDERLEFLKKYL